MVLTYCRSRRLEAASLRPPCLPPTCALCTGRWDVTSQLLVFLMLLLVLKNRPAAYFTKKVRLLRSHLTLFPCLALPFPSSLLTQRRKVLSAEGRRHLLCSRSHLLTFPSHLWGLVPSLISSLPHATWTFQKNLKFIVSVTEFIISHFWGALSHLEALPLTRYAREREREKSVSLFSPLFTSFISLQSPSPIDSIYYLFFFVSNILVSASSTLAWITPKAF